MKKGSMNWLKIKLTKSPKEDVMIGFLLMIQMVIFDGIISSVFGCFGNIFNN